MRLTSFLFTYPRMIHAELMTHRVFSRNASSSRAIPISKMIERVRKDPAMPEYWGANRAGMQAELEIPEEKMQQAKVLWLDGAHQACVLADKLHQLGVHKQLANRPLEPFSRIQVIVTSRYWHNAFGRRAHGDAQPEFQVLMFRALERFLHSKPKEIPWGGWHLPYDNFNHATYAPIHEADPVEGGLLAAKVVTARCARTSYMNFHGKLDFASDLELHDQLLESKHVSPFEHAARADQMAPPSNFGAGSGWYQYRKMLPGEDGEEEDLEAIYAAWPSWIKRELTCPTCSEGFDDAAMANAHANECPTRVI